MPRPFYSSVYRGDVRLTGEGIAGAVLELWPRRRAREGLRDGVESAIRRSAIRLDGAPKRAVCLLPTGTVAAGGRRLRLLVRVSPQDGGTAHTGILGFFYNVMPLSLTLVFAAANVLLFPSGVGIYALRTQTFLQSARRIGRGGAI
jgi:hypothetical protein